MANPPPLNFAHLRSFWSVAREGSMTAAARALNLRQPTISQQVADLEAAVGTPLFERTGRGLALTPAGKTTFAYATQLFAIGSEMLAAARGTADLPATFHVGVSDVIHRSLARALLAHLRAAEPAPRLLCAGGKSDHLLANLAAGGLDLVITDEPLPGSARVRGFSHRLGEVTFALFAARSLPIDLPPHADPLEAALRLAPLLLPAPASAVRRSIDAWLDRRGITPAVAGEFDDTALLKSFGHAGHGLFFAPALVAGELLGPGALRLIAHAPEIVEPIYAVTTQRTGLNPAVNALIDHARATLAAGTRSAAPDPAPPTPPGPTGPTAPTAPIGPTPTSNTTTIVA